MKKVEYIVEGNDLYNFNVDEEWRILSVCVTYGNCCRPYVDIPIDNVPKQVLEKLYSKLVKERKNKNV